MHGYETKELREAHLDALVQERASAEHRLEHSRSELEAGAEGPQKAYHERVAERAEQVMAAVDAELKTFSASAKTRRARSSKRAK